MLSKDEIRESWEAERENITVFLLKERFNPKRVHRVVDNCIDSMVYANLPCTSEAAIKAVYRAYIDENGLE